MAFIVCVYQENADNICIRDFYVLHRSTISIVVQRNPNTVLFNKNTFSQEWGFMSIILVFRRLTGFQIYLG